ncbi:M20 family metallopeptidase [Ruania zhangjianzhongii]|uniref:M20 family metallopeptidase n=1 Tax=Ruania zhangjianzhongii TaxID=2603206 RepID=UPI001F1FB4A2|nr:M20 family metallopeptidase [Ruania zhangjianzhongii]
MPGPYDAFLRRKNERLPHRARPLTAADTPHAGLEQVLAAQLDSSVDRLLPELQDLSRAIHADPELGFEEVRTVDRIADLLAVHGVPAQVGAFGLPTALRARAGSGEPRVAVVAEYDALPDIGHGCGHNIIAASAIGAFLALREIVARTGGTVELIGTPAEENGGGKELILRAGGFDGIGAAVMAHPGNRDVASWSSLAGVRRLEATFTGAAAHAAAAPFLGRNALDATVLAYQGIAMLRQHMLPTDRVHVIVPEGGDVANVVPERASLRGSVRSLDLDTLAVLSARVEDVLRGAALATGTELSLTWDPTPPYLPMRPNLTLCARYVRALEDRRETWWHVDTGDSSGSTDMGNVSYWVPAIHPTIAAAPIGMPSHSGQMAEQSITEAGDAAIRDAARALARVAGDFLADAQLREAVADEFDRSGGPQRASDVLPGYH